MVCVFSFQCKDTNEPDRRKKYFLKEEMVTVIGFPDSFLHRGSVNEEQLLNIHSLSMRVIRVTPLQ